MQKRFFTTLVLVLFSLLLVACHNNGNGEEPTKYVVEFDVNGGRPLLAPIEVEENSVITEIQTVTKQGYEFLGWFDQDNVEFIVNQTKVVKDLLLTASWRKQDDIPVDVYYEVSFVTNGADQANSKVDVLKDTKVTLPILTKEGNTFVGWFTDPQFINEYIADSLLTADLVLYAKWKLNEGEIPSIFTVEFNAGGGTPTPANQTVTEGDLINQVVTSREGFILLGWYTTDDLLWNFETMPVYQNLVLTAKWHEKTVIDKVIYEHDFFTQQKDETFLSFDSGNAVTSGPNEGDTVYGVFNYEGKTYTHGYKLDSKGWIEFTTTEDDLVLTLVVGRRLESGSIKVNSEIQQIVDKNAVFTFNLTTASTYRIERGGGQEVGVFYLKIERNTEKAVVTFDSQGGSNISNQAVELGGLIERPNDPTRDGYDFIGWFADLLDETPWDFDNQVVVEDLTLFAKWGILARYEITIDGNIHEIIEGRPINILPTQVDGKVFIGWEDSLGNIYQPSSIPTGNLVLTSKYRDIESYTISFDLNGGEFIDEIDELVFSELEKVVLPNPVKEDFVFVGFYLDIDFNNPFTSKFLTNDITLYARWVERTSSKDLDFGAYFEAIWAEWTDVSVDNVSVSYQITESSTWVEVDSELIRSLGQNRARVDIVGLKAGMYNIKINTNGNNILFANGINVEAHDRSGYAHFNYTEGIGGYKDDGTLKEDTIVVYVTEENKDTITIPGIGQVGLGWILNNNQYNSGSSNTKDPVKYQNSLAFFNKPIVFRLIGTITTPAGATIYNSTDQGGSKGDNGNMVRMRNANQITIEGIGEDAVILGWGMHFMAMDAGRGIGFEVRNITFDKYPEDAVGLEGVQQGGVLTSPVKRGWIHNNTFLSGYSPNPAESDKADGDGSLDIKRGEYFTIGYNQFIHGSKTNLVGASDSNLQYHITYHHNWWLNSRSRIPLARQANIHMYNNVFEIDENMTHSSDYVQDARANAYIFSEANFFIGTKNASIGRGGGVIKSYGDIKYSTYNDDISVKIVNRTDVVPNSNKYSDFDTNPEIFYFDTVTQTTKATRLTDALTARRDVYMYSGVNRVIDDVNIEDLKINNITPTLINETLEVTGSNKIAKGTPLLVFEILTDAQFEMTSTSSVPARLVTIYGEEVLTGSGIVELKPGVYSLESAINHAYSKGKSQAKEATVTYYKIELDTGAASQARIEAAQNAINNLPDLVEYTNSHRLLIELARGAFDNLRLEERKLVDESLIIDAWDTYINKGILFVENEINKIGVVNEDSLNLILVARNAYDQADSLIKVGISNYNLLVNAEADFEQYKVISLINFINSLPVITEELLNDVEIVNNYLINYNNALNLYLGLDEDVIDNVENISKVHSGIINLELMITAYETLDEILQIDLDDIKLSDQTWLEDLKNNFDELPNWVKELFTEEDIDKLNDAWDIILDLRNQTTIYTLYSGNNIDSSGNISGGFFSGKLNRKGPQNEIYYNDIKLNDSYEINSSAELIFTVHGNATLNIMFERGGSFILNGNLQEATPLTLFTLEITAGTYTITKGNNSNNNIAYVEVIVFGN